MFCCKFGRGALSSNNNIKKMKIAKSKNKKELIFIFIFSFRFSFISFFHRISTDFFIIFLQCSQIFTSFGKLTFFHTFTNVPMDKGSLGVHKVKFMVDSSKDFSNSSRVGNHCTCTSNLSEVSIWNLSWWLIINTTLKTGGAPVHKLDSPF